MRHIVSVVMLFGFGGCSLFTSGSYAPLETVPSVDLQRYTGVWYEISSLPVKQQKGCSCTKAEYTLRRDGTIGVVNSCKKEDGISTAEGKAFVVEGSGNARLTVQFFWPFRGEYWILALDDAYSYAVVGTPDRKYCWILSRTPAIDSSLLASLKDTLKARGFATEQMQTTTHNCD